MCFLPSLPLNEDIRIVKVDLRKYKKQDFLDFRPDTQPKHYLWPVIPFGYARAVMLRKKISKLIPLFKYHIITLSNYQIIKSSHYLHMYILVTCINLKTHLFRQSVNKQLKMVFTLSNDRAAYVYNQKIAYQRPKTTFLI